MTLLAIADRDVLEQRQFVGNGRYQILSSARDSRPSRPTIFNVLVAYDWQFRKRVILKTLNLLYEGPSLVDYQALLAREAEFMRHLNSRRFAHLLDTFTEQGQVYLVIDYIEGETLSHWMLRQPELLPITTVLHIGRQIMWMLHFLHTQYRPIIHRDIKPLNLMVIKQVQPPQLMLIDFGIARFTGRERVPLQLMNEREYLGRQDTYPYMGTWGYTAPEQCEVEGAALSGRTTPASDVYSAGAILHQLLSGEDPTQQSPFAPFSFSSLKGEARIPKRLAELVHALLSYAAEQRPTTREAHAQLTTLLAEQIAS